MSHAWERLRLAMHTLAQTGMQRERLARVIVQHLTGLRQKDLPAEIRGDFAKLLDDRYVCRTPGDVAAVKSQLDALNDADIGGMIDTIIGMYDAVARYEPIPRMREERQTDPVDRSIDGYKPPRRIT